MKKSERAARHTKRLEVEFGLGNKIHKGFLSNLSESGVFIRSSKNFLPGSDLDIKIYMPDGNISCLQGTVMRQATDIRRFGKSGMGIKLTKVDENFIRLLEHLQGGRADIHLDVFDCGELEEALAKGPPPEADDSLVIKCPHCGAKNRVPRDKLPLGSRCGKCKQPLQEAPAQDGPQEGRAEAEKVMVECPHCGARNRVPRDKLSLGPKCGSCKQPLETA